MLFFAAFVFFSQKQIREIRVIRGCSVVVTLRGAPNFPRNLGSDFGQYTSERPEMSSPWHAVASAKAAMTRDRGRPKQERKVSV
jgi:hypothetical protein